jgi:hypothetical protein
MPAKQTREAIEAELNESEKDRVVRKLREIIQEWDAFEKDLQQCEHEAGLPAFYRSKSIAERMAAVGMSQQEIEHVTAWMEAVVEINSGRANELPDHVKTELAAQADAELTGAELLADIVQAHRKEKP